MHVDREKFDGKRQVSGEKSRGLKLKQRTQAKMLHCGTKATSTLRSHVSGYFESATFSFRIRNYKLVRLNFDFSYTWEVVTFVRGLLSCFSSNRAGLLILFRECALAGFKDFTFVIKWLSFSLSIALLAQQCVTSSVNYCM